MTINNIKKAFVKKFSDSGCFYAFDVNTNQVIEIEKTVYDIIADYENVQLHTVNPQCQEDNKKPVMTEAFKTIEKTVKELNLFSNFRPQKVTLGVKTAEGVRELHKNGLNQIILELTCNCNLNCAYCPISGKYSPPNSAQLYMTIETCKKAVDFFCERSTNKEDAIITFYGGEPVKSHDLIKETVAYARGKYGY